MTERIWLITGVSNGFGRELTEQLLVGGDRSRPGRPGTDGGSHHRGLDVEPAPLRIVLRTQALDRTIATLRTRIEGFEAQRALAASTDFPAGE